MRKLRAPWRLVVATVLAAAGLVVAMPAAAEDNWPDDPAYTYGCADGNGNPHREGEIVISALGSYPFFGPPGQYICVDGGWVYIGGWIFMEGAPSVTAADTAITVDEGGTASTTGTVSDTGDGPIAFSASVGTVTAGPFGTWSWSYSPIDGPAQSQSVIVTATSDRRIGGTTFDLTVGNVAPTVTSLTPDTTTAIVGRPVTFSATAADPSPDDATAGFAWAFGGTAAAGGTFTTSFAECGAATVTATATDKDGGTSAVATSEPVTVVETQLMAPLRAGSYNLVRSGQVVPVRLAVGCGGASAGNLSPSIQVTSGDGDPETDAGRLTQSVAVTNASGADTTNVMRLTGGAYLYNLRVPSAPAGSLFTVHVRPFGDNTAVNVVLKIRG